MTELNVETGKPEFKKFPKIPRLSKDIIITEKIDGTNAQIYISDEGELFAGSRNRYITIDNDNYGFAKWCNDNKEELLKLGAGIHFGEWWGVGIQRGYGLSERRFSLFNVSKWGDNNIRPMCCHVVPIIAVHTFDTAFIEKTLTELAINGSWAAPGYDKPEGIVVYHTAGNCLFKKTILKDDEPKRKKENK